MIKQNKYTNWYNRLIERAVVRNWRRAKGRERHHIIPQSLGGSNDKTNLTYLSCREHFVCHWLLIKMTDGEARSKMLYALMGMKAKNKHQQDRYETRITSRVYERYRLEHARNHSERMKGKQAWNKGRKLEGEELKRHTEIARRRNINLLKQAEGQQKRLQKVIGQKRSEETRMKMSKAHKGVPKGPMTDEHRAAISAGGKGIKKHAGHGDKVRQANMGVVSINKDGVEKKVKRETLPSYLAQGWQQGGRKRIKL